MTEYEAIFRRKSVRKYKHDLVSERILEQIGQFGGDAVGVSEEIRVKWKIYKASDHKVKGLFQVKAPCYAALYSEICDGYRENAGCLMEQLSLYLHTLGIGSCYQGSAKLIRDEEKGMELMMILAFGYPAEPLERDRADFRRVELKNLAKTTGALTESQKKLMAAARLAPSAMNLQPWRFVATGNRIHLFVKRPGKAGYNKQLNRNLFHAGIVLSHMLLTAEELWLDVEYGKLERILEKEFRNYLYAGSVTILE